MNYALHNLVEFGTKKPTHRLLALTCTVDLLLCRYRRHM